MAAHSQQSGKRVQDQGRGDRDIEAVAGTDHWDLHREIELVHGLGRNAITLVAQHDDGAGARRWEVIESYRFVGELDADNLSLVRMAS
ncbi:hypothetical protein AWC22_10840 [Mycobacterium riyadhense]|uniref:Uncharacterized protein n=1 Tax=Mycobacterium riyadhense TaxID=486698 RepID=A0A1X2DE08_9MYCO|nr:hypothetical protein AWC22_10840 [Mycobacterium riyadhense]